MNSAVREHYDAHPDPATESIPIGPGQLERVDDNLHYGWSWHRYRFYYRKPERLRILDVGCGTGLGTLGLARLNPGSSVLGIDVSGRSLDLARQRVEAAGLADVSFQQHDVTAPLPGGLGPFDFIVCRGVLGEVDEPRRVLEHLTAQLDARGLLLATFPSRPGRMPVRALRRAIQALAPVEMALADRAAIGIELFQALRHDHPIRWSEAQATGRPLPDPERLINRFIHEPLHEWNLEDAMALVEQAGLQFLHAPARQPWVAARVFAQGAVPAGLKRRVEDQSERARAILMDALDPTLHGDEYRIYACLPEFEPRVPGWPEQAEKHPEAISRVIPHPTGLSQPANLSPDPATARGAVTYWVVTGVTAELDVRSHLVLAAVDGKRTCQEVDAVVHAQTGVDESPEVRRDRWLSLAHRGLILLESPDPRQNVDCQHLRPVRDRLDCPCPRRWVRGCERHGLCTIDVVSPDDPQRPAYEQALARLGVNEVMACARCPDYLPEE